MCRVITRTIDVLPELQAAGAAGHEHHHVFYRVPLIDGNRVVELGDMCYSDKERFPSGPWCKKGDFIMCRANTGTRFKIHGVEFRLINDDSVEAVVQDPRGIGRVN